MTTVENYEICIPSAEEADMLDENLLQEIQKVKPVTQKAAFVPINVCAKFNGELVGGVLAYAVMWDILYIDTVWTREDHRGQGIASCLMREVEKRAVELGCNVAHLSTYDFQAPRLYKKLGYTKFGEIDYGHCKEIFYYKPLTEER